MALGSWSSLLAGCQVQLLTECGGFLHWRLNLFKPLEPQSAVSWMIIWAWTWLLLIYRSSCGLFYCMMYHCTLHVFNSGRYLFFFSLYTTRGRAYTLNMWKKSYLLMFFAQSFEPDVNTRIVQDSRDENKQNINIWSIAVFVSRWGWNPEKTLSCSVPRLSCRSSVLLLAPLLAEAKPAPQRVSMPTGSAGAQGTVGLSTHFQWMAEHVPAFRVPGTHIHVLTSPDQFYQTMKVDITPETNDLVQLQRNNGCDSQIQIPRHFLFVTHFPIVTAMPFCHKSLSTSE